MAISCRVLAAWYSQLATGLEAGIPLVEALERFRGPRREWRQRMAAALRAGRPLERVLQESKWLPQGDRPAMSAGARSGRLSETLRVLSRKQEMLARQGRQMRVAMVYPMLVLHFGAFIVPISELIFGDAQVYLRNVATLLVPLWVLIAVAFVLLKRPGARARILRLLPLWRRFWKNQALADFCFTLEAEIAAGATVVQAWGDAADASEDPAVRRGAKRIAGVSGREARAPGELLEGVKIFPDEFVHLYQAGEISGKLTENLNHLSNQFRENAESALTVATVVYSKLLIVALALWVGYQVVSFYIGYFERIDEMLQF